MNIFKRKKSFLSIIDKKSKKRKNNKKINNRSIKVECIYHDNFIKIMNAIIELEGNNKYTTKIPEILDIERTQKSRIKGEEVRLSSNMYIKDSVLYSIEEEDMMIKDFGNIILKISISKDIESMIYLYKVISSVINMKMKSILKVNDDNINLYLIGSYLTYNILTFNLNSEYNNPIVVAIRQEINSIIPRRGQDLGLDYFKALEDNVVDKIESIKDNKPYIQLLSFDTVDKELQKEIEDRIYDVQYVYLILDNICKNSILFKEAESVYNIYTKISVKDMINESRSIIKISISTMFDDSITEGVEEEEEIYIQWEQIKSIISNNVFFYDEKEETNSNITIVSDNKNDFLYSEVDEIIN